MSPIATTHHPIRVKTSEGWMDLAIQGPPGAAMATYLHSQGVAAAVWDITHGLGRFPSVTVLDSSQQEIEAQVDHISTSRLVITFDGPTSGSAALGG